MTQQVSHDFQLPQAKTITVDGKQIRVYDELSLRPVLTIIKAALDSLAGRGSGQTQVTGPMNMNKNLIKGVVNSAAPANDEAVSFALAQSQYTVYRPNTAVQNANYKILPTDGMVRASAPFAANAQQLPPASTVLGKCFTIKKSDSTTYAVNVTTSVDPITGKLDNIDGQPLFALTVQYKYVTVRAGENGTYDIVANN